MSKHRINETKNINENGLITDTINFGVDETKNKESKKNKKNKKKNSCTSWGALGGMLVAVIVCCLFIPKVLNRVGGDSMNPNAVDGDWIIVNIFDKEPERGDMVSIRYPDGGLCIKRVIGLPGDTIDIDAENGDVYINGTFYHENYIYDGMKNDVELNYGHCEIPEGYIYVMGDNREVSDDSRTEGPMPIENIVGKAYVFTFNTEKE